MNLGLLITLHKKKIFPIMFYNSVLTSNETHQNLYIKMTLLSLSVRDIYLQCDSEFSSATFKILPIIGEYYSFSSRRNHKKKKNLIALLGN
jgi:hypothetical protein